MQPGCDHFHKLPNWVSIATNLFTQTCPDLIEIFIKEKH